jgi:hypothetical protein
MSVEYVLSGLTPLVRDAPDCCFIVTQKKFFRTTTEFDPDLDILLFKHPSFQIRNGEIVRYSSHDELRKDFDRRKVAVKISVGNVVLIHSSDLPEDEVGVLGPITELVDDLYHQNIYPDIVASSAKKFVLLAGEANPNLTTDELLQYLAANYQEVEGLSVLSYHIKREKNKRNRHLMELHSVDDFGVQLAEISDELDETIRYCSEWRRMSDGFFQTETGASIHFAVVPMGSSRFEFEPEAKLREFVVVFSIDRELDEFLVRFLEYGIDHIDQRVQFEFEAKTVRELGALKRLLQSEVRNGNLRDVNRPRFSRGCLV